MDESGKYTCCEYWRDGDEGHRRRLYQGIDSELQVELQMTAVPPPRARVEPIASYCDAYSDHIGGLPLGMHY